MEVLTVIALLSLLILAAVSAVTLLDRTSRRQADHTTALELAQGRLDEFLAQPYNPPVAPYKYEKYSMATPGTLALTRSGTKVATAASVITLVEPVVNGHLVTVLVSYTNYSQPATVRLQTLVNKLSGGQP